MPKELSANTFPLEKKEAKRMIAINKNFFILELYELKTDL